MNQFFRNWNAWRFIRLALSVVFVVSGIMEADYFLIAGGVFIMYQAVFNTGCCATGNCEVDYSKVRIKEK